MLFSASPSAFFSAMVPMCARRGPAREATGAQGNVCCWLHQVPYIGYAPSHAPIRWVPSVPTALAAPLNTLLVHLFRKRKDPVKSPRPLEAGAPERLGHRLHQLREVRPREVLGVSTWVSGHQCRQADRFGTSRSLHQYRATNTRHSETAARITMPCVPTYDCACT